MKRLLLGLLLSIAAASPAQIFSDGTKAYMVGQATPVSAGTVVQHDFSPSGNFVLFAKVDFDSAFVARQVVAPPVRWFVHRVGTTKTTTVNLSPELSQSSLSFMGNERYLVFQGVKTGIYDLETGQVQLVPGELPLVFYAGTRPSAPFLLREVDDMTIGLIRPGAKEIQIKVKQRIGFQEPYSSDAQTVKFAGYTRNSTPMSFLDVTVNLATTSVSFKVIDRKAWDALLDQPKASYFKLGGDQVFATIQAREEPKGYKGKLKLSTKLCPLDFKPRLAPTDNAVAYVDAGALLVRPIREIDRKLAEEALEAAEKAEMLSMAKQVGVALIIYASDMDDVLPNADKFNDIYPYIKNRDMMKSFTYTYSGGPMNSIGQPAQTELGYVQGATGRAVVYADGHAKWIPNT